MHALALSLICFFLFIQHFSLVLSLYMCVFVRFVIQVRGCITTPASLYGFYTVFRFNVRSCLLVFLTLTHITTHTHTLTHKTLFHELEIPLCISTFSAFSTNYISLALVRSLSLSLSSILISFLIILALICVRSAYISYRV